MDFAMDSPPPNSIFCPLCRASNPAGSEVCSACGQSCVPIIGRGNMKPAEPAIDSPTNQRTYTLSSLMLVIALIAVCLGVLREVPGVGVVLVIVLTPALVRTLIAVARRKAGGAPMTSGEKMLVFAGSTVVVTAIGVGGMIAFVSTCVPVGCFTGYRIGPDPTPPLAVPAGIVAALIVVIVLGRRYWPLKD